MLLNILQVVASATLVASLPSGSPEARWANVSTPVVDLGYARYQGTFDPDANISYFFGIRYAQAPTGKYRQPIFVSCSGLTRRKLHQRTSAGGHRRHRHSPPACSKRRLSRMDVTKRPVVTRPRALSGPLPLRRGPHLKTKIVSSLSTQSPLRCLAIIGSRTTRLACTHPGSFTGMRAYRW